MADFRRKRVGNFSQPIESLSRLDSQEKETNYSGALCFVTPHYLLTTAKFHANEDLDEFICNPDLNSNVTSQFKDCAGEEIAQFNWLVEEYGWNQSEIIEYQKKNV